MAAYPFGYDFRSHVLPRVYAYNDYYTPRQSRYYSPRQNPPGETQWEFLGNQYASARLRWDSSRSQCSEYPAPPRFHSKQQPWEHYRGTHVDRQSSGTRSHNAYSTFSIPGHRSTIPTLPPRATPEDARQAGIPAGFCYKNWDPFEEPIILLGSVFDAHSLGKWIYDWAVFFFGPVAPMTDIAGDFWLLLIHLAGKMKQAEEVHDRIRRKVSRELVDDFLQSGKRLWQRFSQLLQTCEAYMWKAVRKEKGVGGDARIKMGKRSGCEFVDAMFGRDRELICTEKLMNGMRLWSRRFDANCENILCDPSA